MRRPVTFAGRLAIDWIKAMAAARVPKLPLPRFMSRHGLELASQCAISPARCRRLLTSRPFFYNGLDLPVWQPIILIICAWNCPKSGFGDGCAPLCWQRDGRIDGLWRIGWGGQGAGQGECGRFHRLCYRLNSAFLWSRKGRWHYAPRLDWLCRINRACRRNVP